MKLSNASTGISVLGAAAMSGVNFLFSATPASAAVPVIQDPDNIYTWPAEDGPHEGTWLQWPHNYGWDPKHVQRYEESWIQTAKALHSGERVHIIVYDDVEMTRVSNLLASRGFDMTKVDLYSYPTDDVWIRDSGPIFVFNKQGEMLVEDWKFNGWGNKADWWLDDYIPNDVAWELNKKVELVRMVNEGGSIEVDGRGTLLAKKSSILNNNRNPGWTQADVEAYFRRYLGVTTFIWLDGTPGLEITDDHIDGSARFAKGNIIVTHARKDFTKRTDYDKLVQAKDAKGASYKIVILPLTARNAPGTNYKGLYINYYVGNTVVIVPSYNDPNDVVAANVLKNLYPEKKIVQINFTELYKDGGIVHCVTMHQPAQ